MSDTLANNDRGTLWNVGNETIQDSKVADASKFRVGAPFELGESGGGGAFSFDVTGGDIPGMSAGKRIEVVLMTGGMNAQGGGETGLFVTKKGTWGNISDAAQIRVWEITSDGIEFKVPISAPNLPAGGGSTVIQSPNGRVLLAAQDDGNLVLYVDGAPLKALFGLENSKLW